MIEQAAAVGLELSEYLKAAPGGMDEDRIREKMARLVQAHGSTPLDALAYIAWADALFRAAVSMMPDDDEDSAQQPKLLAAHALMLSQRAMQTLEIHTGAGAESFMGPIERMN